MRQASGSVCIGGASCFGSTPALADERLGRRQGMVWQLRWVPTHGGLQLGAAGGPADARVPRGPQPPHTDLEVPCPLVRPMRRPHLHASTPAQWRRHRDISSAGGAHCRAHNVQAAASSCCLHRGASSTDKQQAAAAGHHAVALPRGDGQPVLTECHLRRLVHLAEPHCAPAILHCSRLVQQMVLGYQEPSISRRQVPRNRDRRADAHAREIVCALLHVPAGSLSWGQAARLQSTPALVHRTAAHRWHCCRCRCGDLSCLSCCVDRLQSCQLGACCRPPTIPWALQGVAHQACAQLVEDAVYRRAISNWPRQPCKLRK